MEVNELRIGNFVEIDNPKSHPKIKGIVLIVTEINKNIGLENETTHSVSLDYAIKEPNTYYSGYAQYIKFIKPITLTEDWLIRFGFENIGSVYEIGELNALNNRDLTLVLCTEDNIISYNDYLHPILYVHQLQNLYFAITGKELTLNQ